MNRTVRFISAYQYGSNAGTSTIFFQQHSYFDKEGDSRHPRKIFQEEICELLYQWINKGNVIIMCIDINENIIDGELSTKLK